MATKAEILHALRDEFQKWTDLPEMFGADQVSERSLPADLSLKDIYAHLWAWQQRTIARLQAAVDGDEPRPNPWPAHLESDSEDDLEAINAWIHETCRDRPWVQVYQDWRSGYQRLIELAEKVPEKDLLQTGRYPWLSAYPLAAVLEGTYDHHYREHREPLMAWLSARG